MAQANRFHLHMMAAVTEHEAHVTSERTRAALAATKRHGVAMGWAILDREGDQLEASRKGASTNSSKADQYAANLMPAIQQLRKEPLFLR